jgi:hypothetical protein
LIDREALCSPYWVSLGRVMVERGCAIAHELDGHQDPGV